MTSAQGTTIRRCSTRGGGAIGRDVTSRFCTTGSGYRLEIANVDATHVEGRLGTDVIYYSAPTTAS
jgi:hypothetical protein